MRIREVIVRESGGGGDGMLKRGGNREYYEEMKEFLHTLLEEWV